MTKEDDKLRKTFGIPTMVGTECDYQEVECDIRGDDMECLLYKHPMEVCPGEEEEEDEDD